MAVHSARIDVETHFCNCPKGTCLFAVGLGSIWEIHLNLPRRLQWRGVSIKILTIPVPFAPKTSLFGIGSSKTLPVTTEHLLLDGANSVLWNVSHVHVINTYPLPFHSESSHNFLVPADGCFSRGISMRKWPKNVIFNFYHNIAFIWTRSCKFSHNTYTLRIFFSMCSKLR